MTLEVDAKFIPIELRVNDPHKMHRVGHSCNLLLLKLTKTLHATVESKHKIRRGDTRELWRGISKTEIKSVIASSEA